MKLGSWQYRMLTHTLRNAMPAHFCLISSTATLLLALSLNPDSHQLSCEVAAKNEEGEAREGPINFALSGKLSHLHACEEGGGGESMRGITFRVTSCVWRWQWLLVDLKRCASMDDLSAHMHMHAKKWLWRGVFRWMVPRTLYHSSNY